MLEGTLPGQSIVIACVLTLHRVLVVADVIASSNPTSACLFGGHIRVHQGPHSMVIERIWLNQVNDIKSVIFTRFCVGDAKVVPLCIPSGIIVWLQNQIVFILINLNSSPEISTFKS